MSHKTIFVKNQKINNLTIIKDIKPYKSPDGQFARLVLCKCNCGNFKKIRLNSVMSGRTKSCGCIQHGETNILYKHGMSTTRFYRIYKAMHDRCENNKTSFYHIYGGKGIKVCKRWNKFKNFRDDMYKDYLKHCKNFGEKNTSIDRIKNNKDYKPSNCKWSDPTTQANNSSNCHYLEFNGKKQSIAKWARELGISYHTLRGRIYYYNWSVKDALTIKPILGNNQSFIRKKSLSAQAFL